MSNIKMKALRFRTNEATFAGCATFCLCYMVIQSNSNSKSCQFSIDRSEEGKNYVFYIRLVTYRLQTYLFCKRLGIKKLFPSKYFRITKDVF